jgi:hypothetical protein
MKSGLTKMRQIHGRRSLRGLVHGIHIGRAITCWALTYLDDNQLGYFTIIPQVLMHFFHAHSIEVTRIIALQLKPCSRCNGTRLQLEYSHVTSCVKSSFQKSTPAKSGVIRRLDVEIPHARLPLCALSITPRQRTSSKHRIPYYAPPKNLYYLHSPILLKLQNHESFRRENRNQAPSRDRPRRLRPCPCDQGSSTFT